MTITTPLDSVHYSAPCCGLHPLSHSACEQGHTHHQQHIPRRTQLTAEGWWVYKPSLDTHIQHITNILCVFQLHRLKGAVPTLAHGLKPTFIWIFATGTEGVSNYQLMWGIICFLSANFSSWVGSCPCSHPGTAAGRAANWSGGRTESAPSVLPLQIHQHVSQQLALREKKEWERHL